MQYRFRLSALILVALIASSCSGGGKSPNPVEPSNGLSQSPEEFQFNRISENTIILGAWQIYIDPLAGEVNAVPLRTLDAHFNVSPIVRPPNCSDCFKAKNLNFDPDTKI